MGGARSEAQMTTDRGAVRALQVGRPCVGNSAELLPRAKTVKYAATVGAAPACGRGEPGVAWSESGAGRSFRLAGFRIFDLFWPDFPFCLFRLFCGHARHSRCSDSLFLNFQRFVH